MILKPVETDDDYDDCNDDNNDDEDNDEINDGENKISDDLKLFCNERREDILSMLKVGLIEE